MRHFVQYTSHHREKNIQLSSERKLNLKFDIALKALEGLLWRNASFLPRNSCSFDESCNRSQTSAGQQERMILAAGGLGLDWSNSKIKVWLPKLYYKPRYSHHSVIQNIMRLVLCWWFTKGFIWAKFHHCAIIVKIHWTNGWLLALPRQDWGQHSGKDLGCWWSDFAHQQMPSWWSLVGNVHKWNFI